MESTLISPTAFLRTLADILRLPDNTLATAYLYQNRYHRFIQLHEPPANNHQPIDHDQRERPAWKLDPHTLALTSLLLSTKSTSSQRRPSALILTGWRLLHPSSSSPSSGSSTTLTIPSPTYDILRTTLLHAEQVLLRILGFELRVGKLAATYLPSYLERALGRMRAGGEGMSRQEGRHEDDGHDEISSLIYDSDPEAANVLFPTQTGLGLAAHALAIETYANYSLANFFPARAIAAACLFRTLSLRGVHDHEINPAEWLRHVTKGKVEAADLDELLKELERPADVEAWG